MVRSIGAGVGLKNARSGDGATVVESPVFAPERAAAGGEVPLKSGH